MPIRAALRHPTAPTRPPWIFGHLQQHRHEALPAPGRSRFPEHPDAFNTPSWTGQACSVPNRTTGSTLAGGLGLRPHRQLGYPYQHRTPKAFVSWNDPGVPTQAPARPASMLDHTVHVHAAHPHPRRGRRTRCPDHARQATQLKKAETSLQGLGAAIRVYPAGYHKTDNELITSATDRLECTVSRSTKRQVCNYYETASSTRLRAAGLATADHSHQLQRLS